MTIEIISWSISMKVFWLFAQTTDFITRDKSFHISLKASQDYKHYPKSAWNSGAYKNFSHYTVIESLKITEKHLFNVCVCMCMCGCFWLIVLESTLMGHFVSFPREREKRDRRDSRGDEREGQGREENEWKGRNKKLFPPLLLQGQQALPNCKPNSVGCPCVVRYTTPLPVWVLGPT